MKLKTLSSRVTLTTLKSCIYYIIIYLKWKIVGVLCSSGLLFKTCDDVKPHKHLYTPLLSHFGVFGYEILQHRTSWCLKLNLKSFDCVICPVQFKRCMFSAALWELMTNYLFFLDAGCKDKAHGPMLKELMQTTNFRVTVVEESDVVEICGALKVGFSPPLKQIYSFSFATIWARVETSMSSLCLSV